jgi:TIR domain
MEALKLFISYAHEDESYRASLEKYLIVMKLQGIIEHWDDRKIVPGDKWEDEINAKLEEARMIVLLVSIDFLNSDYIRTKEMRRAIERYGAGDAMVVPVLVRTTPDWNQLPGLGALQALPVKPGTMPEEVVPVKKWDDYDEAWTNVVSGLRRMIEKFQQLLTERGAPPPAEAEPKPAAATAASADGLKALRKLMADPAVLAVSNQFRTDLAGASQHIVLLGDYKDLHDALHDLHFRCYNFVLQESRRPDAGQVNWDGLVQSETTLQRILEAIHRVAARATLPEEETKFAGQLDAADKELQEALDANSLSQVKQAVRRISRVLAIQPSQINLRLSDAARGLPLAELESGMNSIRSQLNGADLPADERRRFTEGVTALGVLRDGVRKLCAEHDAWQEIDAEMRRIETQIIYDLGDLEFSWEGLRKKLAARCAESDKPWGSSLMEEVEKLDSALAGGAVQKVISVFRRCYSKAGARFYDVDFELKELCDELRKVGTELDKILGTL